MTESKNFHTPQTSGLRGFARYRSLMKRMTAAQATEFFVVYFEKDELPNSPTDEELRALARQAASALRLLAPDITVDKTDAKRGFSEALRRRGVLHPELGVEDHSELAAHYARACGSDRQLALLMALSAGFSFERAVSAFGDEGLRIAFAATAEGYIDRGVLTDKGRARIAAASEA